MRGNRSRISRPYGPIIRLPVLPLNIEPNNKSLEQADIDAAMARWSELGLAKKNGG